MKIIIRLSAKQEARALPILLRHSPGTVLADRTYVITEEAANALRLANVKFKEISRETDAPGLEGVLARERI